MFDQRFSLQDHCLLSSGGFGEVRERVSHYLWPHQMKMQQGGALQSQLYGVFFGSSALFDLHYGAPVEIDAGDISDYYLIRLTLEGGGMVSMGKQQAVLRKGGLTISSPSQRSFIRIDKDCRNLILRVDRQALERQLQVLLNRRLRQPLVFDIQVDPAHQGMATVRSTLDYIGQLYGDASQSLQSSAMGASLSDYLLSVLLTQLPHNYSVDLLQDQRQPMPHHVKKARDYIEQHLAEPIALSSLAQFCEVSIRTLQNGFTRFLQQTPSDYVRTRRLALVHLALQKAGPADSVTDILLRHGVASFGHFAMQYRKQYGCLPSETLRRQA
jgi:AraC-like DNA-binding protein